MDRKVLQRFFAGTASFEEEEAVCNWVDASDENREELIRERKYFDILLLRRTGESDMASSPSVFCYQGILEDCSCDFHTGSLYFVYI